MTPPSVRLTASLGIEHKILEKKGAWIAYEGSLVGQGRDAAKAALKEKPELAEKISKAILDKVVITATGPKTVDEDEAITSINPITWPHHKMAFHARRSDGQRLAGRGRCRGTKQGRRQVDAESRIGLPVECQGGTAA